MTCTEFRDVAELLRDGALEPGAAAAARDHRTACADCRSFERECAILVAPLGGLPPAPYVPPAGPGTLPPWASGPVFGVLLALLLAGGGTAWAVRSAGPAEAPAPGPRETASVPAAEATPAPAPPEAGPPPPSIYADEGGFSLTGRVLSFPGGKAVPGVRILVDGIEAATTDVVGVFRVRGLAPAGTRLLRLVPPSGPPSEALLPSLAPGQSHSLADLLVGPPSPARVRVVRSDARPGAGVRVRACPLAPSRFPDSRPDWKPGTRGTTLPAHLSVLADEEGWADFPSLPPGRWTFQAEVEGTPFSRPADLDIRDDPDARATLFLEAATALVGRVLDADGEVPVAGATVRWSRVGPNARADDVRFHGATVSGADGAFRFPAAPAVPLLLEVRGPGSPCRSGGIALDAGRVGRVDIRLPRTSVLAGACVDGGTGLPAAGVHVRVTTSLHAGAAASGEHLYTRSGPDGRFEIRGVPEDALLTVVANPHTAWRTRGFTGHTLHRPGCPVRIEVLRAGSIRGVVRQASGRPAPGRTVAACGLVQWFEDEPPRTVLSTLAVADGEGRFLLEDVPPGRVAVLSPEPEDLRSLRLLEEAKVDLDRPAPPSTVVEVGAGTETVVEVPIRRPDPSSAVTAVGDPTLRLRGTVLDPDGAPVPGTHLFAMQGDLTPILGNPRSSPHMWTPMGQPVPLRTDGSFVAELPFAGTAGAFTFTAFSPAHPPTFAVARIEGRKATGEVAVRFGEGRAIEGRVLREDGGPAVGALLEALAQADVRVARSNVMVRARTAEDGSFRIEGLPPGPHTLVIGWPPGPEHRVAGLLPGRDPVEVRLPPGGGTSPGPRPLPVRAPPPDAACTATVEGTLLPGSNPSSVLAVDPFTGWTSNEAATVDGKGRFLCRVPPGGRLTLAADLGRGRWLFADDVPAGTKDLVLRADGPAAGLLRGRVVTPAGAAASGVPVHAVRLDLEEGSDRPTLTLYADGTWGPFVPGRVRTTLAGPDGSFDLGSPPGRWAVLAGRPGTGNLAPGSAVPWHSGDPQPVEVPLAPGHVLSVQCGEGGATPVWAEARLDSFLDGPVVTTRIPRDGDGLFRFRGLPPGPVTVVLLDEDRKEIGRGPADPGDPRDPPVKIAVVR